MALGDLFRTPHLIRSFKGHSTAALCVAFSPDGQRALSGEGAVLKELCGRYWNVETGEELGHFKEWTTTVAFRSDGTQALYGTGVGKVAIRDLTGGGDTRVFVEKLGGTISSVSFSHDGSLIVSAGYGAAWTPKPMIVWDVATGKEIHRLEGHKNGVYATAMLLGNRFVSAAADNTLRFWDLKSGRELATNVFKDMLTAVAYSPQRNQLLVGQRYGKEVILWDIDKATELRRFRGHRGGVWTLTFSPDGRRAISGSEDHTIRVWDVESGVELRCLKAPGPVYAVSYSPNGTTALTGGKKSSGLSTGWLNLWDVGV